MYSLAVSAPFNIFVVIIVVINTVQMIMLTSPYARALYGLYIHYSHAVAAGRGGAKGDIRPGRHCAGGGILRGKSMEF